MRRLLATTLLAFSFLPTPHAQAAAAVDLRITEILPEPDTTTGQREFIEVWNAGNTTVDLAGWKLHDAPTASGSVNTFTFPAWTLRPNARVVVWGGGNADGRGPAWSNGVAWNNAGDGAHLLDAAGRLVDWAGYGTATPPPGFEPHLSVKPAKALSTELESGSWVAHEPTPGAAPGATAGTLALEVSNVAPRVAFVDLPASARPGTSLEVRLAIADDNGESDLHSWNLTSNGVLVAHGSTPPAAPLALTVPTGATWTLVVQAQDVAGLGERTEATLALRSSDLLVLVPAGGLALPPLGPGAARATAAQPVTLQNLGTTPLRALVDVSDFTGPATFPAEGHLELGFGTGDLAWTPYDGPLTPLGPLAPGESAQLWFRVTRLPVPLAAGSYGTSFTVVAG